MGCHRQPKLLVSFSGPSWRLKKNKNKNTQHIPTTEDFQDVLISTSLGPDNIGFDLTRTPTHRFQPSSSLDLSCLPLPDWYPALLPSPSSPSQIMTPSFIHHPHPHQQILVFPKDVPYYTRLCQYQHQATFVVCLDFTLFPKGLDSR